MRLRLLQLPVPRARSTATSVTASFRNWLGWTGSEATLIKQTNFVPCLLAAAERQEAFSQRVDRSQQISSSEITERGELHNDEPGCRKTDDKDAYEKEMYQLCRQWPYATDLQVRVPPDVMYFYSKLKFPAGWCTDNASDVYSGGVGFESQPGHRLSSQSVMGSLTRSGKTLRPRPPRSIQFIFCHHCFYIVWDTGSVVKWAQEVGTSELYFPYALPDVSIPVSARVPVRFYHNSAACCVGR
jgi:hypothetical protein